MIWYRKQHEHDYQPVAVQHTSVSLYSAGLPATLILRRCSCGEVESVDLAGRWTLAQIRGGQEATEAVPDGN